MSDEILLKLTILEMARITLAEEGIEVRPLTFREIEDISGVTRGTAWNTEQAALAKLRRQFAALEQTES